MAKGLCSKHYLRLRRTGKLNLTTCKERLLGNIKILENGCWQWQGSLASHGYGQVNDRRAHRVSYEIFVAPIPERLFVCHKCDNPGCVNPEHLFVANNAENMRDAAAKGRFPWQKAMMNPKRVAHIRRLRQQGWKLLAIASKFGISESGVHRIVHKTRWA